jgi:hypothetical protein
MIGDITIGALRVYPVLSCMIISNNKNPNKIFDADTTWNQPVFAGIMQWGV